MAKKKELWERQKWDTPASFKAFARYLSQEVPRTVNKAWRDSEKAGGKEVVKKNANSRWRNWSNAINRKGKKFKGAYTWLERANAYDDYQAWLDRDVWEKRRAELREKEWGIGGKLHDLATGILEEGDNFLKTRRQFVKGKEGKPDQVIITVALDANLAVKAANIASKLQRLAAGLETSKQTLELKHIIEILTELPDSELDELISQFEGAANSPALIESGEE